jgi:acetyltransferase-like isoleucine patch superfamily enzyme
MKIFRQIKNFFYNMLRLYKMSANSDILYWDLLAGKNSNCKINPQSVIMKNHSLSNVSVGKGTYIADNAIISDTTIGKFCSIGPNLLCGWGIHPIDGISTSPAFYSTKKQPGFTFSNTDKCVEQKHIIIGNDVFIGANVTILDGIVIGHGAVIGAGAIVSKDIPPYAIAVGSPIQIVKYRFSPEIINELLESNWWDDNNEKLHDVEVNFFEVEKFLKSRKK